MVPSLAQVSNLEGQPVRLQSPGLALSVMLTGFARLTAVACVDDVRCLRRFRRFRRFRKFRRFRRSRKFLSLAVPLVRLQSPGLALSVMLTDSARLTAVARVDDVWRVRRFRRFRRFRSFWGEASWAWPEPLASFIEFGLVQTSPISRGVHVRWGNATVASHIQRISLPQPVMCTSLEYHSCRAHRPRWPK